MRRARYIPIVQVNRHAVSANEGYAIALRNQRASLAVTKKWLADLIASGAELSEFGHTREQLEREVKLLEGRVRVMALY